MNSTAPSCNRCEYEDAPADKIDIIKDGLLMYGLLNINKIEIGPR